MTACAVLHVTSIPGGGVDRHLRDIAAANRRPHYTWHVGEEAEVLEQPAEPRFLPLAAGGGGGLAADFLRARGVGLVHVHSLSPAARRRGIPLAAQLGVPTLVTLHDVLFLGPGRFLGDANAPPDAAWLAQVTPVLRAAAGVLAPSRYIASLAREHCGIEALVVPNGIEPAGGTAAASPRPGFDAAGRRVVAVLGALGPHKGSRTVEALARRLAGSDIVLVVVGYTDAQAWPGWFDDHLFIHGPYEDSAAGALLRAYGAELVLFPNPVPESFSYALSEAWGAGLPVLVPPEGALGERVGEHGGGWILPRGFTVADIVEKLRFLGSPLGRGELARVRSSLDANDPHRLPRLDAMNAALEDLYRRFGIATAAVDPLTPPAQSLIAAQLDSRLFRRELITLAEELARLREGPDAERRAARKFEIEARAWIAKLEDDVRDLQSDLRNEVARREALQRAPLVAALRGRLAALLPAGVRRALRGRRD